MTRSAKWRAAAAALALLAAASLVVPKLALFVAVATLVAFLALPKLDAPERQPVRLLFAVAGTLALVGLLVFIVKVAVPSLVLSANKAQAFNAVTRLREVLLAEDAMRKQALIDPDRDGVGSAALVSELRGSAPLRNGATLPVPLLNQTYSALEETRLGPAALVSGYYVIVCLPRAGGGWTARPGEPVDEEASERRFVAYAWPGTAGRGPQEAFFIDEHHRILVRENRPDREYAGVGFPPACDAALAAPTAPEWQIWRGKQPRSDLPGDG